MLAHGTNGPIFNSYARLCTLMAAMLLFWALAGARADKSGATILLYHRFHPVTPGSTTVTKPVFEEQLAYLSAHRYNVVPLKLVVDILRGRREFPPHTVAITVDDGRRSQYTDMFPIIQRYHMPVTLFVYTDAISRESDAITWAEVGEMLASGLVDVQSHTCSHPDFEKERLRRTPPEFEAFVAAELTNSRKTLEEHLHRPIDLLAWPYGIVDADLQRAAARAGYVAAFSVGGRFARVGGEIYAVPRIVVSGEDRGAGFARLLEPNFAMDAADLSLALQLHFSSTSESVDHHDSGVMDDGCND
jgi:peptidoglycan/xylan/chitin deacetylase (PgdA/CDA1 family)